MQERRENENYTGIELRSMQSCGSPPVKYLIAVDFVRGEIITPQTVPTLPYVSPHRCAMDKRTPTAACTSRVGEEAQCVRRKS